MEIIELTRPTRAFAEKLVGRADRGPQPAPIIVFGPRACGKTRNKRVLAQMLGCGVVVDDWRPDQFLVPGALHLTDADPRQFGPLRLSATVLSYENLVYGEEFL